MTGTQYKADSKSSNKTYRGTLKANRNGGLIVMVHNGEREHALNPRFDLFNHSPCGFQWGYSGSGPAQLALAICADILGKQNDSLAVRIHQDFKREVVVHLRQNEEWTLTYHDARQVIDTLLEGAGAR